jgi:AcrR family transcriptional regulator
MISTATRLGSVPVATRERLVSAAWECVRDQGPAGATSRAITAAAGANLGAITYYFGSKDALVAEAVGTAIEELVHPAREALRDETLDPVSRMLGAVARLQQAYARSADDAAVYLEAMMQCRRRPDLRQRIDRTFAEIRAEVSSLLAGLQTTKVLPEWVHPDAMAGLLVAVAQGVVLQTTVDTAGPSPVAMADQFTHLLLASRVPPG